MAWERVTRFIAFFIKITIHWTIPLNSCINNCGWLCVIVENICFGRKMCLCGFWLIKMALKPFVFIYKISRNSLAFHVFSHWIYELHILKRFPIQMANTRKKRNAKEKWTHEKKTSAQSLYKLCFAKVSIAISF